MLGTPSSQRGIYLQIQRPLRVFDMHLKGQSTDDLAVLPKAMSPPKLMLGAKRFGFWMTISRLALAVQANRFEAPNDRPLMAHRVVLALLRMAASGRSRHKIFGRPRVRRGRALSRVRVRKWSRPIGSRSIQKTSASHATPASRTQIIRTGALVVPARCTVAAASTYIALPLSGSRRRSSCARLVFINSAIRW